MKDGVRFWTWQQVGGKFINKIPAGTTRDIMLVALYQKDQDTDNIGGSGGGSGRGVSGGRGTVGGNNGSGNSNNGSGNGNNGTGLNNGAQLATQTGRTSSTADGADTSGTAMQSSQATEPNRQNNAATSSATSRTGSKMRSAQGESDRSKARRLPKTGEAAAADGLRGAALGLLLAGLAVRRKREEQ